MAVQGRLSPYSQILDLLWTNAPAYFGGVRDEEKGFVLLALHNYVVSDFHQVKLTKRGCPYIVRYYVSAMTFSTTTVVRITFTIYAVMVNMLQSCLFTHKYWIC